jgi:hypothetical protein
MDSTTASRMVFVSGGLMATYVLIEARGKPQGSYRQLWAVGALTVGLSVFADFMPKVAGPAALLILVAMVARNTGALGGVIGGAAPPAKQKAGTK